jgi:hypothetical protein
MIPPPIIELMIERAASITENPVGPSATKSFSLPKSAGSTYDPP